jgi:hypothetical protein
MFQTLDEQIKYSQGRIPAAGSRMLQYAGAFIGTVFIFGGLYLLIFMG